MSFDYDRIHAKKQAHESFWASYADLYLMLAVVFLMMYVVASLRTGTEGMQQKVAYQRLAMETEDLREQTKVYNTLKDDYLEKQASEDEQKVYAELMKKLTLLQDDARKEKEDLRQQAAENEKKEYALNKYQQIVRNIINANMLAKAGLKSRDEVIETKRQTIKKDEAVIAQHEQDIMAKAKVIAMQDSRIAAQEQEINQKEQDLKNSHSAIQAKAAEVEDLQKAIAARQKVIADNEAKIRGLNSDLQDHVAQLEAARDAKKVSEAKAGEQIEALKAQAASKIKDLEAQSNAASDALQKANAGLKSAETEKASLKAAADAQAKALSAKIAALGDQVADAQGKLAQAEADQQKFKDYIGQLKKEKDDLADDLAASKAQLQAKANAAKRLKDALGKAGVKAQVDKKSGDVLIEFGDEYFDTGSAELKPRMRTILGKAMPAYADSLFKDKRFASKIASIEVVGFASPTYKGRYVDPSSLSEDDRAAVTYNLDLSYNRAKSIFNYVFDTQKLKFKFQKDMLPLVKVSGRSYLGEGIQGRDVQQGISIEEYCAQYDCRKAQKVIIKFNLKDN